MNRELPHVQAGFRKGRGTRDQIAKIHWIIEKAREFQENICFIDYTKAFDCVDRGKFLKEELWMEVFDFAQEAKIKIIPKKKKCKKAKWLSEEALQIAEKRKEVKGKGEKESYTHLNTEFQSMSR